MHDMEPVVSNADTPTKVKCKMRSQFHEAKVKAGMSSGQGN